MIEKLSSLCVRFMPTFVSPATSMRSPTREWSCRSVPCVNRALRSRAQGDHRLAEFARAEDEKLDLLPDRALGNDLSQLFGRLDGRAVDGDDGVGAVAGLESGLFCRAARRDAHDLHALHV